MRKVLRHFTMFFPWQLTLKYIENTLFFFLESLLYALDPFFFPISALVKVNRKCRKESFLGYAHWIWKSLLCCFSTLHEMKPLMRLLVYKLSLKHKCISLKERIYPWLNTNWIPMDLPSYPIISFDQSTQLTSVQQPSIEEFQCVIPTYPEQATREGFSGIIPTDPKPVTWSLFSYSNNYSYK